MAMDRSTGEHSAFVNGRVLTMEPELGTAEAVSTVHGVVDAVGSTDGIKRRIGPDTEVVDLDGRTVVPGFVDAHQHPLGYGFAQAGIWVDCSDVTSIDDLVAKGEARAAETPDGEWVYGRGWPVARLERLPRKEDFAGRVDANPVWFNDLSGHLWILNQPALDAIGLDADTPEPDRGIIDRAADGEPTGVLRDCTPFEVGDLSSPFGDSDVRPGLEAAVDRLVEFGITTFGQIGIRIKPDGYGTERVRPWIEMDREGELKARVRLMLEPYRRLHESGEFDHLAALADLGVLTGFGTDRVKLGPLKIIADGWQDSRSGYMKEPYASAPSERGYLKRADADDYRRMIEVATEAGLQVAIHADGDASAEVVLDAYESVREEMPERFDDLRHRFEHARILTDEQVERIADLGIHVNAAPVNYSREPWYYEMLARNVGPEREHRLLRHKTLWEEGVRISGGSDLHPGIDRWMSPISALHFLVNEGPEDERFTPSEALRMYTINGAYSYHAEDEIGSIAPGKAADMVVLSADPTTVPTGDIDGVTVERTIVGGETVYGA